MNGLREIGFAGCVVLCTATSVGAATITYTDLFDPGGVYFDGKKTTTAACTGTNPDGTASGDTVTGGGTVSNPCASLTYMHTLDGYLSPPDTLLSAYLDLYFWDDYDPGNNPETVRITLDGSFEGQYLITSGSTSPGTKLKFDVRTLISPEGALMILLERGTKGQGQADFWFGWSELTAQWLQGTIGEPPPAFVEPPSIEETVAVPEPSVLLLLASGLGPFLVRYRRRAARSQGRARS